METLFVTKGVRSCPQSGTRNICSALKSGSKDLLLGKRPNSSSLNKWKDQLSDLEIKYFNYYNKDLLEYFDYKIEKAKNLNPLIKYPLWIKGLTEFVLRKIYREVKNII